jgi:hypothetical protein
MRGIERDGDPETKDVFEEENIVPGHFYAAYVFDNADTRKGDVGTIIDEAKRLGYPIRYWWLSQAMDLGRSPDRMIICVHHPSAAEDAGMDLYQVLREKQAKWDDLEAAHIDEYRYYGHPIEDVENCLSPNGSTVFFADE